MEQAIDDLTVLDRLQLGRHFGLVVAMPFCAMLLADLGAPGLSG